MSSEQNPNEPMERLPGYVVDRRPDPDPIEVRGLHGEVLTIGSAESADQDGLLLCLGSEELWLDARGADDLVHAVLEARSSR